MAARLTSSMESCSFPEPLLSTGWRGSFCACKVLHSPPLTARSKCALLDHAEVPFLTRSSLTAAAARPVGRTGRGRCALEELTERRVMTWINFNVLRKGLSFEKVHKHYGVWQCFGCKSESTLPPDHTGPGSAAASGG